MEKNSRVCVQCGAPRRASKRTCGRCGYTVPGEEKRHPALIAVSSLLLLGLLIGFLFLSYRSRHLGTVPGVLDLGDPVRLTSQTVPAAGGEVRLDGAGVPLNGLCITVPEGAFGRETEFTVTATPVKAYTAGKLFNPVTPLITIDGGRAFAGADMTVKIPVSLHDGEFAMAFFFDRKTGSLEGIPCLRQDADSVTVVLDRFSDLLVSKTDYAELDRLVGKKPVDSGFLPGRDDFAAPNYGSYAAPDGQCSGQSVAALLYYTDFRPKYGPLRRVDMADNNKHPATPDFYYDDALAYRMCSKLQPLSSRPRPETLAGLRDAGGTLTYYSFLYAILLTGEPQLAAVRTADDTGGHVLIVYKVTENALWLADPNYPGHANRKIAVQRVADAATGHWPVAIGSYNGEATADGVPQAYPRIAYFGHTALIDGETVRSLWSTVLSGRDAASSLYPSAPTLAAAVVRNVDVGPVIILSPDNPLVVSEKAAAGAGASKSVKLSLAPATPLPDGRLYFYSGTKYLGLSDGSALENKWFVTDLQPGVNDIGALYKIKGPDGRYQYVDFYRFKVIL